MSGTNTYTSLKDYCPVLQILSGEGGVPPSNAVFDLGHDDVGCDFKVYGATSGCYVMYDESANQLQVVNASYTENEKPVYIYTNPTDDDHGCRQGAVHIYVDRLAANPWVAGWGGDCDTGMRMVVYNRSNSLISGTYYGETRGLDINARNRSGAGERKVLGAYITGENESGSLGCVDCYGMEVHAKNNGVATGDVVVLRVYDESQSYTGTSYAILVDCTNNSPFAREYCIYINSGASSSWTNGLTFDGNITNPFDFADTNGTNGATYNAGGTYTPGNLKGKIKVDVGGNTLYLALYDGLT